MSRNNDASSSYSFVLVIKHTDSCGHSPLLETFVRPRFELEVVSGEW